MGTNDHRSIASPRLIVFLVAATLSAAACSGTDAEGDAPGCPAGTTPERVTHEVGGPGAASREDAIRSELQSLGLASTDEAIAAGAVASSPGDSPGSEEVQVATQDGLSVTMTLTPLDPGWAVNTASWCAAEAQ